MKVQGRAVQQGARHQEPGNRVPRTRACAGAAADNHAIRNSLQEVCNSIWVGKRSEMFSFSFSELTHTRPKNKKIKKNHTITNLKNCIHLFPASCFCGTLTVTHSRWVNKLQSLNCILEQGTSDSYNGTGLDGKAGVNLTSVHRFVWCLYIAFLSLTPGPPPLPHTIPISSQRWCSAQISPIVKPPVP